MLKRVIIVIILIASLAIIYGLIRQISTALSAGKRLDLSITDLTKVQDKNKRLQAQLKEVENVSFVEKELRDKLNLSRSNETVVIIPDQVLDEILKEKITPKGPELPYWQGWLRLFIN